MLVFHWDFFSNVRKSLDLFELKKMVKQFGPYRQTFMKMLSTCYILALLE